jgi:5-methylcytosine-specific restriction endonuclease McrA
VTGPDDPLFWMPSNHQPICNSCHRFKTASEGRTAQHKPSAKAPRGAWRMA